MSYDWRIESRPRPNCECCGRPRGAYYGRIGNPTYNLGGVFRLASGGAYKQEARMPLPEALLMLTQMLERLKEALADEGALRAQYVALLAPNGWGTLEDAVQITEIAVLEVERVLMDDTVTVPKWQPLDEYARPGPDDCEELPVTELDFIA